MSRRSSQKAIVVAACVLGLTHVCSAWLPASEPPTATSCVAPSTLEVDGAAAFNLRAGSEATSTGTSVELQQTREGTNMATRHVREDLARGGWFVAHGQPRCASPLYADALQQCSHSPGMLYALGTSLSAAGQPQQALKALNRSLLLAPDSVATHLALGIVLHDLGKRSQALGEWQKALTLDPISVTALDWIAKAHIEAGNFAAAIDGLRAAPADEELTLDLAVAYSKAGMIDQAVERLESAKTLHPQSVRLRRALATLLVQQHRYDDAIHALRTGMAEIQPDKETQLLELRILVLMGDNAEARPIAERLLANSPHDFDLLYLSGLLERQNGEYSAAKAHLESAVALAPDHYDSRYNLGATLAKLHDDQAAARQLERAIALDRDAPEAHFQLSATYKRLGQMDLYRQQLTEYQTTLDRRNARDQAANLSTQAAEKLAQGDAATAANLYLQAATAAPEDAIVSYNLALALDRSGDPDGEEVALAHAVASRANFAEAENQLGYLAAQRGDSARAEHEFRAAIHDAPDYAEAENNLGTLLASEGHDQQSIVLLRSAVTANPRFTEAWVNLAAAYASTGQFADARKAVNQALRLNPADSAAGELNSLLDANRSRRP